MKDALESRDDDHARVLEGCAMDMVERCFLVGGMTCVIVLFGLAVLALLPL